MIVTKDMEPENPIPFEDMNLTGRHIIVHGSTDPVGVFRVTGGFGCLPPKTTSNPTGKVYGQYVASGEETYTFRSDSAGLATDAEIERANQWATQPKHIILPAIAEKLCAQICDTAGEISRDQGNRCSKDSLRSTVMELTLSAQQLCRMVKTLAESVKQTELEGVNAD